MDWEDREFEAFLRQFRPRKPKALPARGRVIVALAVAAALLVAVAIPMRSWWIASRYQSTGQSAMPSTTSPANGTRPADGQNQLVAAPADRVPQVMVSLAAYRPSGTAERQVNVSIPTVPTRKPASAPKPEYPGEALRLGFKGTVELRLTVSAAGDVTETERLTSSVDLRPDEAQVAERAEYYARNPYGFAVQAENAAKEWKFEPARSAMALVVSFTLSLQPSTSPEINPRRSASPEINPQASTGSPTLSPGTGLERPGPPPSNASGNVFGSGGSQRLKVGGAIKPPRRLVNVNPEYPEDAQAAGISGVVLLQIVIGEDGSVIDAQVIRSIPELDQAALDAVYQWQYEPTLLNGEPVELEMTVTINFTLR